MAPPTGYDLAEWENNFIKAGISVASAKIYAQSFFSEEIMRGSLHRLERAHAEGAGHQDYGRMLIIL